MDASLFRLSVVLATDPGFVGLGLCGPRQRLRFLAFRVLRSGLAVRPRFDLTGCRSLASPVCGVSLSAADALRWIED